MKPTIYVLGTGPGIENFNNNSVCIGVNDIWKYYKTNYLLLLDRPDTFTIDRIEIIKNSEPVTFFSNLYEWSFLPKYKHITVNESGGDLSTLNREDFELFPRHVDSTFTAVCIAYRLGYRNIILHGVHLKDHPILKSSWPLIKDCYSKLFVQLKNYHCSISVNDNSPLLEVLPKYQNI